MKKKIEIENPEGKVAEWKEINGVTTMVAVDEADNRQLQKRIKTKKLSSQQKRLRNSYLHSELFTGKTSVTAYSQTFSELCLSFL